MMKYVAEHPEAAINAFKKPVIESFLEALKDATTGFLKTGFVVPISDAAAEGIVEGAKHFAEGLENLAKLSQSRT